MDVRQLRYFVCIAELGSLSAASHRLGIAQPSLSQHVKHLEEELGIELLVRSPRGVSLTESGQVLLAHANRILRAIEIAITDLRNRTGEPHGPVSFGMPSSAGNVLFVPLAETICHQFPNIMLRAMDAMSGHVQEWLTEGVIDLGILYDINAVHHLRTIPLVVEELFLVVARHGWAHQVGADGISEKATTLAECAQLGLIVPHRTHGLRETIERYADTQGVKLKIVLEMDSLTHIKALVARGLGYSILAPAAVAQEIRNQTLALVPIREPTMRRTVYLVRNPSRPVTQAALEVERVTIDIVAELVSKNLWRGELAISKKRDEVPRRPRSGAAVIPLIAIERTK